MHGINFRVRGSFLWFQMVDRPWHEKYIDFRIGLVIMCSTIDICCPQMLDILREIVTKLVIILYVNTLVVYY